VAGVTPRDLAHITGARIDRATTFLPFLEDAMHEFQINTPQRQAAFLAQIAHESGSMRWLVEIWGPTASQGRYEMRYDLGNIAPGDGFKYRGRGLIQLTGRANYKRAAEALGVDLIAQPELLGEPAMACRSAAWFWKTHGCNEVADEGDFEGVSKIINRGDRRSPYPANGYAERLGFWERAKERLS
jgi:putative chitinase